MNKKRVNLNTKKIVIGLVVAFLIIQFVPSDKSVPDYEKKFRLENAPMADLNEILPILNDACYDCHSYDTRYPSYAYIAPVSWWMQGHVRNGRKALNFSTLLAGDSDEIKHALYECAEEIEEGKMPPKGYVRMHSEADLSESDRSKLVKWLKEQAI